MGIIANTIKNNFGKWTNPRFYTLLRLIVNAIGKNPHKTGTIKISGFIINYNDAKALIGMYNEIIYQEHYKFIPSVKKPIIIDCGANIGISVLYFQQIVPNSKIIAIEADPDVAEILQKNLVANNCQAEIIQKAAWSTNGELLSFGKAGGDSGSIYSVENVTQVETVRLKDILDSFDEIELLKIDIEGAEIEVVKDCCNSFSKVNKIFIEFHSFPGEPQCLDKLLKILSDQGFRYKILPARKMSQPFMQYDKDELMDLQLNIFFYKI